jgi:hypothetical protein
MDQQSHRSFPRRDSWDPIAYAVNTPNMHPQLQHFLSNILSVDDLADNLAYDDLNPHSNTHSKSSTVLKFLIYQPPIP